MTDNAASARHESSRRLVAILFADIVGYSKMMHSDEEEALKVLDRFKAVLQEKMIQFNGEVVKSYGDGSLCLFTSAVEAMHCAKEMQLAFRHEPKVPVRMGIHTGDIIRTENDTYGDGINIASRLESIGIAGSVQFTKSIYDKIRNHKEFEVRYLGNLKFKNITDSMFVYALANEGISVLGKDDVAKYVVQSQEGEKSKWLKRAYYVIGAILILIGIKFWNDITQRQSIVDKTIAVLPFRNESSDRSNDYFCNGIMEDLLTQLQKIGDLQVKSRTAVLPYQDAVKPIEEIAKELNVAYILDGSVRKSGNDVLITTQLIEGKNGTQTWADSYDEQLSAKNIFDIQRNIATKIATKLKAEISPGEQEILDKVPTENTEAYDSYLRGMYFYNNRFSQEKEFTYRAIAQFEKAVQLDPNFAFAHLRLAYCHDHLYWKNFDGSNERAETAKYHFEKARELLPNHPDIIEGGGWYAYHIEGDYKKAREIFRSLANQYPNLSTPLNALGVINNRLGNWEEAGENFEQSISLDPEYLATHLNYFYNLFSRRNFLKAKNHLDWILNISPENNSAHIEMSNLIVASTGNTSQALDYFRESGIDDEDQLRKLLFLNGDFSSIGINNPDIASENMNYLKDISLAFVQSGRAGEARPYAQKAIQKFEEYLKTTPRDYMKWIQLGQLYSVIDYDEKAMDIADRITKKISEKPDALMDPDLEYELAKIHAYIGQSDDVFSILRTLVQSPSKVTPELIRVDPTWNLFKADTEYEGLVTGQPE